MSTHPLIDSLRPPVATILDMLATAEARYCLGEATTFEPAKIHAAWPDIFRPDTVTALRTAGLADGAGRPFVGLVLQALIEAETAPLHARIAEREKAVTVTDANGARMDLARARRLAARDAAARGTTCTSCTTGRSLHCGWKRSSDDWPWSPRRATGT
ncbi:hypothetical protein GCM10029963_71000 [Micromonospora andamanensis]